jgi:hypothetical protein
MKKLLLSLLLLSLLHHSASAQIEDLTKDSAFFQKQAQLYQRWLDHSGLGKLLKVHTIEVKPQELSLYLAFPFENIDSVVTAWKLLKTGYESSHPVTLEQELFYKMVNMMEVHQSLANVQLYDTYNPRKEPLFFRGISFVDGWVYVEEPKIKFVPDNITEEIFLKPADFKNMKTWSVQDFQQKYDRQTVYNKIYECARQRFERKVCDQRNPKVRLLENQEVLRFEVVDLCREVLTDEANPTLCRILRAAGFDCNWVKREMLIFEITHRETPTGFQLKIELDGKYGSGLYETVRRGGYLSMEIDFDDYLERYSDGFREYLRQCIFK